MALEERIRRRSWHASGPDEPADDGADLAELSTVLGPATLVELVAFDGHLIAVVVAVRIARRTMRTDRAAQSLYGGHDLRAAEHRGTAEQYAALPGSLLVRELRYRVGRAGFRTREVTLVTTLLDAEAYKALTDG